MVIKQPVIALSFFAMIIFGFGCAKKPSDIPQNILGYVLCGGTPLNNVKVSIVGKQTTTANDGSFVLNAVPTEAITLVTISGSSLTQTYRTNQEIYNGIKITIPLEFCGKSASNTNIPAQNTTQYDQYQVIFTKPQDGGSISAFGSSITPSPCRGKVLGPDEPFEDLLVRVSIQTNQVYPQGTSRVNSDGSWEVSCNFGGDQHQVQAELFRGEEKLAETTIVVKRVR